MESMANEGGMMNARSLQEGTAVKRRSRPAEKELDQDMVEIFVRRLCNLLDTTDHFGRYATLTSQEKIEHMFLATKEDKDQSDFNCAVSPKVRLQVPVLFQAIAGVMEEKSGALIQSTAEINGEGFGRALVYSGRIILVLKSLRAGFPFPFTSEDKVIRYGLACVEEGLEFLEKYKEMTAVYGSFSIEG